MHPVYGCLAWGVALGAVGGAGFCAGFPTYLSYFLVPVGLKYLKTTVVAMYSYLILVVTTVVSLTLGQDRFSWTQAAAIAMICISVYFVEVAEAKK